jgi:hypothetical protein
MKKYILIALLVLSCNCFAQPTYILTAIPETTWVRIQCNSDNSNDYPAQWYKCERALVYYLYKDYRGTLWDASDFVIKIDTVWGEYKRFPFGVRVLVQKNIDTTYMLKSYWSNKFFPYRIFKIKW